MPYNYYKRRIETTQAKRQARGVDTALNLSNIIEQYTRPKLTHVGPQPMLQMDGEATEWPWVHLDEADSERNTILECASMWIMYPQQTIDMRMFLLACQLGQGSDPADPAQLFSRITLKIDMSAKMFIDGFTSPISIATDTLTFDNDDRLKAYIALPENANRAVLNSLAESYNIGSFDEDAFLTSDALRSWLMYEATNDLELIKAIEGSITIDFEAQAASLGLTFDQIRALPFFIDIEVASIGADIDYASEFNAGGRFNKAPSAPDLRRSYYTRIFNVGSEFRTKGDL